MPDAPELQGSVPAAPPTPTPAALPPAAPSSVAAPVAAPAAPAAAPAAASAGDDYGRLLSSLGYESAEEMRRDLATARQFRAEVDRARQERERSDPARQQAAQRGEAFRQLVAEGYSPEHVDALAQLPEVTEFLTQQRADAAQRDLDGALGELGLQFDNSKDAQALRQAWEDAVADKLNSNPRLNARYFGTPAERKAVIHEIVAGEERRINHILLRQNAQTLRDHAARQSAAPRAGSRALPTIAAPTLTSTDPLARRRESNVATNRQLDDIYAWAH